MKTIINIIIAAIISALIVTMVMENAQAQSELRYKVKQEFTGEVRNGVDSVYSVTCIIDRKALSKYSRLYVKMGRNPGLSDLYKVALDSTEIAIGFERRIDGIKKARNTIEIDMGEHTHSRYIEVWTKEGRYNKQTKRGGDRRLAVLNDRLAISESN